MTKISQEKYKRLLSWGYCSKKNEKNICSMLVMGGAGETTLENVEVLKW